MEITGGTLRLMDPLGGHELSIITLGDCAAFR